MSLDITNFISNFKEGVRPNLFRVYIPRLDGSIEFLCKAAQIPESSVAAIPVKYMGREIKIAGDRTFAPWTVTVINDVDWAIRNSLEAWSAEINTHISNIGVPPSSYWSVANVEQYDRAGNTIASYTISDIFPSNIQAIELSMDSSDTVEEYTVEFSYNYWVSAGSGS